MDPSIATTKLQIFCRNLRSKEMYHQPHDQAEDEFSSGLYWCGKTCENFGPDGQSVGKSECCTGRSCYVS
jgi:hypothetical protein